MTEPVQPQHFLVTGASGFIASHLVAELLAAGHQVRGTVRDLGQADRFRHLLDLPGATERLELVAADLLAPASFEPAVQGVDGVFHTASPYVLTVSDAQRDLVDPAVQGTLGVLRACAASPGVRRVVLTSSMAAVLDEPVTGHVFTEQDWNTASSLTRNPYYFSKAEAEREAWAFMDRDRRAFDLVVVNPFLVLGPALGPGLNPSNQVVADLMNGTYPVLMDLAWGLVDVRDVAHAHVQAMTVPSASWRYVCAGDVVTMRQAVDILKPYATAASRLPRIPLDNPIGTTLLKAAAGTRPAGERSYLRTHLGRQLRFDNSRIRRDLGLRFRTGPEVLVEALADLRARGTVPD